MYPGIRPTPETVGYGDQLRRSPQPPTAFAAASCLQAPQKPRVITRSDPELPWTTGCDRAGKPITEQRRRDRCGPGRFIFNIRQMFRGTEVRNRGDVIAELQTLVVDQHIDDQVREEFENGIRTAVRRGILESRENGLALAARNIADYQRDFLKDQFVAAMQGHAWAEREDSIRKFSRWLSFRRTGPSIYETARSVINGLIRDGRLESNGSQIRRR